LLGEELRQGEHRVEVVVPAKDIRAANIKKWNRNKIAGRNINERYGSSGF
jgi:hypothetical protein